MATTILITFFVFLLAIDEIAAPLHHLPGFIVGPSCLQYDVLLRIFPVSRTGLLPGVPASGTRYSHGTGQNGPKMASKGPFDPPKGSRAKEVIFNRFRAQVGLHRGPSKGNRAQMGQNG